MEARPFIRVSVGGLGLRIPQASRSAGAGVHSSSSPCFCEIRLPNFSTQTASVPLLTPTTTTEPDLHNVAASFHLDEPALQKLLSPTWLPSLLGRRRASSSSRRRQWLEIVVFTGRQGSTCCGVRRGKQLGSFRVAVDRAWAEGKQPEQVLHSGWVAIGGRGGGGGSKGGEQGGPGAELHLVVRVEPDPWYVFQFDGAPSLSPKIVQAQGNSRQPIFSCKFSRCSSGLDQSCSDTSSSTSMINCWPAAAAPAHALKDKERKGWTVTIHDLSGSTLAAASMITPFVPSAGTSRVSKSNPGAWLIMRPDSLTGHADSWAAWGQLEAWRERGRKAGVGCRFQLLPPNTAGMAATNPGILITETVLSKHHHNGAEFRIDTSRFNSSATPAAAAAAAAASPSPGGGSPKSSSGDYAFLNLQQQQQGHVAPVPVVGGFVMSCNVEADGGGGSSRRRRKPVVQLATRHVSTVEDAAIFMALAAAVDLSADICLSSLNKKKTTKSCGLGAITR